MVLNIFDEDSFELLDFQLEDSFWISIPDRICVFGYLQKTSGNLGRTELADMGVRRREGKTTLVEMTRD